jgi:hypothetical protein
MKNIKQEYVSSFGRRRLLAHLSITVQKIRDLRRYQGKNNSFFKTMAQIIMEYQISLIHHIYTFVPDTPGSYIFLFSLILTHNLTVIHGIVKTASVVILGCG